MDVTNWGFRHGKNSDKAWNLIKIMNNEEQQPKEHINITNITRSNYTQIINEKLKGKKTKL